MATGNEPYSGLFGNALQNYFYCAAELLSRGLLVMICLDGEVVTSIDLLAESKN